MEVEMVAEVLATIHDKWKNRKDEVKAYINQLGTKTYPSGVWEPGYVETGGIMITHYRVINMTGPDMMGFRVTIPAYTMKVYLEQIGLLPDLSRAKE
jgi:hypothetical protein